MRRAATILSILALWLGLMAIPLAAADEATPAASPSPSASPATPVLPTAVPAAEGPVVQGVLYFSPTCGHCHYVITEVLPGLFADNGGDHVVTFDQSVLPDAPSFYLMSNGRLQLLMVDVSQPDGQEMMLADVELLGAGTGVPLLHIGDDWYVGSQDIPEQLPGIVTAGLAGEGVSWPPVPGIELAIAPFLEDGSVARDRDDDTAVVLPSDSDASLLDKVGRDPLGNGISILVLIVLVVSLLAAPVLAVRGGIPAFPVWLVPVLAAVGLVVAAYLASIETSGNEAVCGPVGDCNAVQESGYAKLFGIPIGVLGIVGYLLIGGLWVVSRLTRGTAADLAMVLAAAGAFGGTLFSAYLTFLEPFVIGATCMWCITSALVMVALLWMTAGPGWAAWQRLRGRRGSRSAATASP